MLRRVWIPTSKFNSRDGAKVRLIVLHTAEGATTYQELGNYFATTDRQVSSHVGIDDTPGVVGEYVNRQNRAWTVADANCVSVSAETCAFASWSLAEWNRHPNMLYNLAEWIAEESNIFDIPIRKLTPSEAQGGKWGVCQHSDLGAWGGGHTDCGPNFPIDRVIAAANDISNPQPSPPTPDMEDMVSLTSMLDKDGNIVVYGVDPSGNLWEITTKDPVPGKTYRWSNITANGQNGQKLATS